MVKTKSDLIKIIAEAHTKHIINHEQYLGCIKIIDGLDNELNPDWSNTNHDMILSFDEFKRQLKKGNLYENIFKEMFIKYYQELKSHKIQYQETGNLFLETKNKYSGNWEISRTGLLSDVDDTNLSFILERHDITNNKIMYWTISSLKENWIHEIERLDLEETTSNDGNSKGYKVPLNKILHHDKDVEEFNKREEGYRKQRLKQLKSNGHKGL
jgi:hypothetical protein